MPIFIDLTQMERKKWRVGEERWGRSASFWWSVDAHRLESLPGPTTMTDQPTRCQHMCLAVILFELKQPPALHPARIKQSCLAHFFQKQHESCAGLAREKDTDAAIPREAIADRQFTCPRIFCRIPSHAAFREAPIVPSFPPTSTHREPRFWQEPFYGTLDEKFPM